MKHLEIKENLGGKPWDLWRNRQILTRGDVDDGEARRYFCSVSQLMTSSSVPD